MALSTMSAASVKRSPVSTSRPACSAVAAKRTPCTAPSAHSSSLGLAQWRSVTPRVCAQARSTGDAGMSSAPRRQTMLTSCAPSRRACTAASIAVMPPPMTSTRRPTGSVDRSALWRSSAMKSTALRRPAGPAPGLAIGAAAEFAPGSTPGVAPGVAPATPPPTPLTPPPPPPQPERIHARQPQAQEHRVVIAEQVVERHVAPQLLAGAHLDAADRQQPGHLLLREIAGGLVAGQAIFIEAAQFRTRLEQHHGVAAQRQAMGAGQARRPGPDHGHTAARGRCALEQRRPRVGEKGIGGVALQPADRHRLVLMGIAHTGLLAQQFGGADPGADAAERVGLQDGARRAPVVVLRNALDE